MECLIILYQRLCTNYYERRIRTPPRSLSSSPPRRKTTTVPFLLSSSCHPPSVFHPSHSLTYRLCNNNNSPTVAAPVLVGLRHGCSSRFEKRTRREVDDSGEEAGSSNREVM